MIASSLDYKTVPRNRKVSKIQEGSQGTGRFPRNRKSFRSLPRSVSGRGHIANTIKIWEFLLRSFKIFVNLISNAHFKYANLAIAIKCCIPI